MKYTFRTIHIGTVENVMMNTYAEFKGARTMK